MEIATVILRLHPELDHGQRQVVSHVDGPLLVIAGPGAGKTQTIQLRAVNLLLTGQAVPGDLVLCTFGRDAASQLRQRFIQSALACGVQNDLSRARISTIHSLCHQILSPHAGLAGLSHGYKLLGEQEQRHLLREEFDTLFGPDWDMLSRRGWRDAAYAADEASRHFDRICDERIDLEHLSASAWPFAAALGRSCRRYRQLLQERNYVDFAHLQVWADLVLRDGAIAKEASRSIRHLMVDELQDTSHIQMCILKRLSEVHGNIVAVGDDDQAIYPFRGANVANLLQFPQWFPGCRTVELAINYRSHRSIVSTCGEWMSATADWSPADAMERPFRFEKVMAAHAPDTHHDYPAVISVQGSEPIDEGRQLGELLQFLRSNRVISSYNQAAVLLHSVKDGVSRPYLDALERAGIPVRCEPAGHDHVAAADEVLVTTIHQAKGLQWDVVVVGSLNEPDMETDRVGRNLAGYSTRHSFEPADRIAGFDRARRHYVAFTRARNLLVLTTTGQPQPRFNPVWEGSARWPGVDRESLARQRFGVAGTEPGQVVVGKNHLDRLVVRLGKPRRAG